MKKKRRMIVLAMAACLWISGGCEAEEQTVESLSAETEAVQAEDGTYAGEQEETQEKEHQFAKTFGSYEVPDGWIESEDHSTDERFFYVKNGDEEKSRPDNISVSEGQNPYAQDEHAAFREAILRQLSAQISDEEDTALQGNGFTTEDGKIVYQFTIEEENGIVTTMYYIVGDRRYVLIHETNFSGDQAADEAARMIVDTFQWDA